MDGSEEAGAEMAELAEDGRGGYRLEEEAPYCGTAPTDA